MTESLLCFRYYIVQVNSGLSSFKRYPGNASGNINKKIKMNLVYKMKDVYFNDSNPTMKSLILFRGVWELHLSGRCNDGDIVTPKYIICLGIIYGH